MDEKKKAVTVLDGLPYGDEDDEGQVYNTKTMPEGVTSKALYKDILVLCVPSLIELTLMQLASMVDQMMVGQLGSWATAAVGLTTTPKFLLSTVFMSMNVGTMAMVGRYRGQNNSEKANQILRQAFLLNGLAAIIMAIVGVFASEGLVRFMANGGQSEEVIKAGTDYLVVQCIGMFTVSLCSAIGNSQRGSGDSKTGMYYNGIANILNVGFNWVLIYGHLGFPRLEVLGASIATVLGQFIALIIALFTIRRRNKFIRLEFPKGSFRFEKEPLMNIIKIGIPAAIEQLFMRVGMIIFNRTVSGLGQIELATHSICMNIQALTFMNGQGFATATTALVSQSLGKRRRDMAKLYSKKGQTLATWCAVILAVFIFVAHRFLLGLYSHEEAVIELGSMLLTMVAFIQPVQSTQFVLAGSMRGAGDTKYSAMVTLMTATILRTVLALIFVNVFHWGLMGAWYAMMADQAVRTILIVARYRSNKWMYSFKAVESRRAEAE